MARRGPASKGRTFVNLGVYSAAQAAKLAHTRPLYVRRWLGGYNGHPPLWSPQLPREDGDLRLGFLDLMELRFVREFRRHGVSLQHIRRVIIKAQELIRTSHPLTTKTFKTDGRDILAEIAHETGDTGLLNLRNEQWGFAAAIEPSIVADVVFSDDEWAQQWWPLGRDRNVVIDPRREFGQPILAREGVPTRMVALVARAEGGVAQAADVLGVALAAANDAIEFEHAFAA